MHQRIFCKQSGASELLAESKYYGLRVVAARAGPGLFHVLLRSRQGVCARASGPESGMSARRGTWQVTPREERTPARAHRI